MAKVGDAYIEVKPDLDKFSTALRTQMAGISGNADKEGKNTGLRFGNAMQTGVASSLGRKGALIGLAAIMAGPISSVLSGLAGGLTAVAGSVGAAAGSAAAAAPVMASLGQAMGTVKLGSMGMGEALKLSLKAQKTLAAGGKLTKKEQEKLTVAMKDISPAARQMVAEVLKIQPAFKKMQLGVQEKLFTGLNKTLGGLATKFLPLFGTALGQSATMLNGLAKNFASTNTSARAMRDWGLILDSNNTIMGHLGLAATDVFSGIRAALVPLIPFGQALARTIMNTAASFKTWAESAKGAKGITTFMTQAFKSAGLLWRIVKSLGIALFNIFSAGTTTGDSLLLTLAKLTEKFAAWTKSTEGKNKLAAWFEEGRQTMIQVGGLVGDVAKAFGKLAGTADPSATVASLREAIKPILELIQQLNATGIGQQLIDGVTQIATALVNMNAGGGVSAFVGTLASLATTVASIVTSIPGGTAAVGTLSASLGALAAIRFAGSVTGITGFATSLAGLVKSQGGVVGSFDTLRLKGMFMADGLRAAGSKAASGMSTAWTGIQLGGLAAQSGIAKAKSGISTAMTGIGVAAIDAKAKFASVGSSIGGALSSGASKAGTAMRTLGTAMATGAASAARFVVSQAAVGVALAKTAIQATLAAARTAVMAVVQNVVRVATIAWAVAQGILNAIMAINPFVLIIAGILLLVGLLVLAWTRSSTFRNVVIGAFNAVRAGVAAALNAVRAVIAAVWGWAGGFISGAVSVIATVIRTYFNVYRAIITTVLRVIIAVVTAVFNGVRSVVTGVVGGVRSAISSAFNAARTAVSGAMTAIGNAVRTGISAVGTAFGRIRSIVTGALSGAVGWLLSAGGDIIQGLINGISNAAGAVADAARNVARGAVDAVTGFLHIGSPSKVFMEIGHNTVLGFITGLNDSAAAASKATTNLMWGIRAAADKVLKSKSKSTTAAMRRLVTLQRDNLLKYVSNVYNRAVAPAARELDAVNKRIAATTANLKVLRDARAQVAGSVRDVALGARDLFGQMMEGVAPDPAAVLARLKANLAAVNKFKNDMAALLKKGLSGDVVNQIAAQGAVAGGAMANVLLQSTPAQIKELNKTYAAIGTTATATGNLVAGGMYDAGIKAAEGLLKGLQSRKKQLETYLTQLANAMVAALKKALRIKSPSQVMATQVGSPVGLGIVGGLNAERQAMDNALASFITVPNLAVPTATIANNLPNTFGTAATEIRVYVGDREITDIVKVEVGRKADQLADKVTRGKRAVV